MTEASQTSADVLRGQLADVLVDVPTSILVGLAGTSFWVIYEWMERAKELAPKMLKVPPCPPAIRRYLSADQNAGKWEAFTTWRPAVVIPTQKQKTMW